MILITFKISFTNKIKLDSSILENSFSNNKNVVKIENAKLIGNDESNRPYVITAKSSFKNDSDENLIILHSVEADITLENNSWLLLSTEIAP